MVCSRVITRPPAHSVLNVVSSNCARATPRVRSNPARSAGFRLAPMRSSRASTAPNSFVARFGCPSACATALPIRGDTRPYLSCPSTLRGALSFPRGTRGPSHSRVDRMPQPPRGRASLRCSLIAQLAKERQAFIVEHSRRGIVALFGCHNTAAPPPRLLRLLLWTKRFVNEYPHPGPYG